MFSRQRRARVLFGLSDIVLLTTAFETAYQTRAVLNVGRAFFLTVERKTLVLAFALFGSKPATARCSPALRPDMRRRMAPTRGPGWQRASRTTYNPEPQRIVEARTSAVSLGNQGRTDLSLGQRVFHG